MVLLLSDKHDVPQAMAIGNSTCLLKSGAQQAGGVPVHPAIAAALCLICMTGITALGSQPQHNGKHHPAWHDQREAHGQPKLPSGLRQSEEEAQGTRGEKCIEQLTLQIG